MDGETVALDALSKDPTNARAHTAHNIEAIEAALREVGAARSIVIDERGTVLAGEGVLTAAKKAGIARVQVIDADGTTLVAVRRRGLSTSAKARLALWDNRTGELSGWNADALARLRAEGIDLSGLWTVAELAAKLRATDDDAGTTGQVGAFQYAVVIDCANEKEQAALLERFAEEGLSCRPLIS